MTAELALGSSHFYNNKLFFKLNMNYNPAILFLAKLSVSAIDKRYVIYSDE